MEYIQINIPVREVSLSDILVATLSDMGYEGFVEEEALLTAYIAANEFDEDALIQLLKGYSVSYTAERIAQQNWNTAWEQNFEPVVVEDFCTVRADFHNIPKRTTFEIIITPKMSFGTGHHATTQLMMMQMKALDLKDKRVFDFGTGTGILAILAEMLGAKSVLAIDNDEWSVENSKENIERNNSKNISIQLGSLEVLHEGQFDVILANINRNILLTYMQQLYSLLKPGSKLLMSGLLEEDEALIQNAAKEAGLSSVNKTALNKWIALLFEKL